MADNWRNPEFRQNVLRRMKEAIQHLQLPTPINVADMENQVYNKAKTREEYLNFIGKVVVHIKSRANSMNTNQDPIGALQSLASQGANMNNVGMQVPGQSQQNMGQVGPTGNVPPNMIQNLTQRPGQPMNTQTLHNKMSGMNMMQNQQMVMNQVGQMQNMQANPIMMNMNQLNQGSVPQQMASQQHQIGQQHMAGPQLVSQQYQTGQQQQIAGSQMGSQQLQIGQQQQMPGAQMGQQTVQRQQMTGPQQHQTGQPQQIPGQQVGPNQIQQALQNQLHNMQMGHQMGSPANAGMQPQPTRLHQQQQQQQHSQQQQQQHTNQMSVNQLQQQQLGLSQIKTEFVNPACPGGQRNITPNKFLQSPSSTVPSPGSLAAPGSNQMVTSPALVLSPNPQHAAHGGQRNAAMVPSPSSSLNTPAGIIGGAAPSPMLDDQMSQACKEKIQKLRKYIEPLHKMIIKLTSEGYTEKMSKMKKLLEILTNPSSGTKLDVLQKCEVVLEKMDFKKFETAGTGTPTTNFMKENQFSNPLLEVVNNLLQSPTANNTLQRTFGPWVQAFEPEIKNMPPPLKKRKCEECSSEISDILQGEIARIDQRFKISLDPTQPNGSKSIQLVCWLDDKHLPCVPPILITVPEEYPSVSPKCDLMDHEYATLYLTEVKNALNTRLNKLPKNFSVSQLLDSWEMSVREAARPKIQDDESIFSIMADTSPISALQSAIISTTNGNVKSNDMDISLIKSEEDLAQNRLINELLS